MPTEDPFEPGRSIGPYEILRELGRGGMGRVYLAKDTAVGGRLVAIKVILAAGPGETETAHARFFHEVKNLARLDHRNIVTIFTAGNYLGHPYFVMQYIAGRDLMRFVDECATLADRERLEKIVQVMAQVARAVHYAHEKTIVHRDLKPANILISHEADEPMILDFGIAKYLGDTSLTKGPESPGTPAFRAPEQIDVQRKVRDELIDVWALGVVLYRVLTGMAPFKGYDFLSLSVQILNTDPPAPRTLNSQIPVALEAVILACLQKDPSSRPGSGLVVAELLQKSLVDDSGPGDAPPQGANTPTEKTASFATTREPRPEHVGAPGSSVLARRMALSILLMGVIAAAVWTAWHFMVQQPRRAAEERTAALLAKEKVATAAAAWRAFLDAEHLEEGSTSTRARETQKRADGELDAGRFSEAASTYGAAAQVYEQALEEAKRTSAMRRAETEAARLRAESARQEEARAEDARQLEGRNRERERSASPDPRRTRGPTPDTKVRGDVKCHSVDSEAERQSRDANIMDLDNLARLPDIPSAQKAKAYRKFAGSYCENDRLSAYAKERAEYWERQP